MKTLNQEIIGMSKKNRIILTIEIWLILIAGILIGYAISLFM